MKRLTLFGIAILLCAGLMVLSLGGMSSAAPVTLKMWFMPNGPQPQAALQAEINAFNKSYPDVNVELTLLDWGSAWSKITTAATSGIGPDILQLGTTWVAAVSSMGALLPLNDYVSEFGGNKAFLAGAWATSGIRGSKTVTAIPWFVDTRAVYYRTDVFKKLGINPQEAFKNWSTFEAALAKIKAANLTIGGTKIEPLGVPGKNDWNVPHNFAPWIWEAGGDFLTPDAKHAAIDQPASVAGILEYTRLVQKGYVPRSALELNTSQVESNFMNGMYAVTFSGPWLVKIMATPPEQGGTNNTITAKNYAVAQFPSGPKGRHVFFGGSNLSIFKNTKHPKEAIALVKYLTSAESEARYCEATGMLPARTSALDAAYIKNNPNLLAFKQQAAYGRAYPAIPAWGAVENALVKRLGIVWDRVAGVYGPYNEDAIKQELKDTANELNSILASTR